MKMIDWCLSHLVEDWRQGWRWISVQAQTLALAYVAAWLFAPAVVSEAVGPWTSKVLLAALLVLGLGGRFILQGFQKSEK